MRYTKLTPATERQARRWAYALTKANLRFWVNQKPKLVGAKDNDETEWITFKVEASRLNAAQAIRRRGLAIAKVGDR